MMNEKTIFTYLFTHFWDMLTDSKRSQALKGSFSVLIDNVGHSLSFKLAAGGVFMFKKISLSLIPHSCNLRNGWYR